jgi:uncharacterized protein DUF4114
VCLRVNETSLVAVHDASLGKGRCDKRRGLHQHPALSHFTIERDITMNTRLMSALLALALVNSLAAAAMAQTLDKYQPSQRPLGLPLIAKTYQAGSDSTSATFEQTKQSFLNIITSKLPESMAFTGIGLNQLDPQRLYFLFPYAPRVYYLYEGACYDNALGATIASVSAPSSQVLTGNTFTIFPFVHSSIAPVCASGSGKRSSTEPLLAGDWVQLPTVNAGQQLAFFIMAEMDSNANPAHEFYNGKSINADNFAHMIAFFPDNSNFIIIGFEDMYNGGDQDCNDLMFAVDIGPQNAAAWRNASSLPK